MLNVNKMGPRSESSSVKSDQQLGCSLFRSLIDISSFYLVGILSLAWLETLKASFSNVYFRKVFLLFSACRLKR